MLFVELQTQFAWLHHTYISHSIVKERQKTHNKKN